MIVRELIEELEKHNPNERVFRPGVDGEYYELYDVSAGQVPQASHCVILWSKVPVSEIELEPEPELEGSDDPDIEEEEPDKIELSECEVRQVRSLLRLLDPATMQAFVQMMKEGDE